MVDGGWLVNVDWFAMTQYTKMSKVPSKSEERDGYPVKTVQSRAIPVLGTVVVPS